MNLDNIKQHLIDKGVTVWPDMQAPVEIYDDQARLCQVKYIPTGGTESDVVHAIMNEGNQVAFKGIYEVPPLEGVQGNPPDSYLLIRYAVWR